MTVRTLRKVAGNSGTGRPIKETAHAYLTRCFDFQVASSRQAYLGNRSERIAVVDSAAQHQDLSNMGRVEAAKYGDSRPQRR
jgi:hypothetical protein